MTEWDALWDRQLLVTYAQELQASGIDSTLAQLNFCSLIDSEAYAYLLASDDLERSNAGV